MERRYFPRKPGNRLQSVVYKESRLRISVFPTPNQPYDEASSKSRSNMNKTRLITITFGNKFFSVKVSL